MTNRLNSRNEPFSNHGHGQNPLRSDPSPREPLDPDVPTPLEIDDDHLDIFLPDDDQLDPLPEPGDFWIEFDQHQQGGLAA